MGRARQFDGSVFRGRFDLACAGQGFGWREL